MSYRLPPNTPEILKSWGLKVVEVDGWENRGVKDPKGAPQFFPATPKVIVNHHTGTPASRKGDYPTLNVVRDGRSDLPGPLSQFGGGRDGTIYVIAAGKANHAGKGAWKDVNESIKTVGIEWENPGDSKWTAAQKAAMPLLNAALVEILHTDAAHVCGHREWALPAGRKDDPAGIDLNDLRKRTAAAKKPAPKAAEKPLPNWWPGHEFGRGSHGPHVRGLKHALHIPNGGSQGEVWDEDVTRAVALHRERNPGLHESGGGMMTEKTARSIGLYAAY